MQHAIDDIGYQNEVCPHKIMSIRCVYEVFSHLLFSILDKNDKQIDNCLHRQRASLFASPGFTGLVSCILASIHPYAYCGIVHARDICELFPTVAVVEGAVLFDP